MTICRNYWRIQPDRTTRLQLHPDRESSFRLSAFVLPHRVDNQWQRRPTSHFGCLFCLSAGLCHHGTSSIWITDTHYGNPYCGKPKKLPKGHIRIFLWFSVIKRDPSLWLHIFNDHCHSCFFVAQSSATRDVASMSHSELKLSFLWSTRRDLRRAGQLVLCQSMIPSVQNWHGCLRSRMFKIFVVFRLNQILDFFWGKGELDLETNMEPIWKIHYWEF